MPGHDINSIASLNLDPLCLIPAMDAPVFSLGVLKYVACLCKGCDGCCVFVCIVTRGAVGARVWEV